jgi:ABC transporter, ATP-binding protein
MQDIEAITERIILIDKGRILLDGTLNDIKKDALSLDEGLAEFYQTHC